MLCRGLQKVVQFPNLWLLEHGVGGVKAQTHDGCIFQITILAVFRVSKRLGERSVVQFTNMRREIFSPVEVIVPLTAATKAGGKLGLRVPGEEGSNKGVTREGIIFCCSELRVRRPWASRKREHVTPTRVG